MKHCYTCKFWGNGDGTGMPYDAGHMNYCKHDSIDGVQHPSFGVCGETPTMIYTGGENKQLIMTRGKFGCILHESNSK